MKRPYLVFFIAFLPFLAFSQSSSSQNVVKPLTIENIFAEGGYTGRAPGTLEWSPDNKKLSYVLRDDSGEHGELWYVDATTGEKKVLVSEVKLASLAPPVDKIKDEREKERLTRYHVAAYRWAPDSKHLLFDSQGQLWMYDLTNATAIQLTSSADPSQDPKFSPNGSKLAYVRHHNLYVRSISDNNEQPLTKDTDENILNGEVDWVYAEELSARSNYFWSPDGKSIAFLQMDETKVPTYPITNWLPTQPSLDEQKYPKSGDPNPAVRIGVINAEGGNPKWISLTKDRDIYIPRFGWIREGLLWAEVMNRAQDTLDLYFVDAHSGHSRKVLSETAPGAWVNVNDDFKILKSGDRFLWSSWRDGHTQLYLYSFNKEEPLAGDAKLERQLTQGDFEVLSVAGVDDAAGIVYFSCNKGDPRQAQIYSVKLDGSDFHRVSKEDGMHEAVFAEDGAHYADTYSALMTPPSISMCAASGNCHKAWEARAVNTADLIAPKLLEFKADDGATTLYGELTMPTNVPAGAKVPLIVYIYGGPAAQTVTDSWIGDRGLFHEILVKQGFAVFTVDNRGTPARDRKFQASIRREFGALELKDQLAVLKQLYAEYPQLDSSRTGIWGWSNGGSMTLYAMTHCKDFKAGVAVAPVTDLKNYDSIYNERFWGLPKDEPELYNNPITKSAANLSGSLLIVHGTSDDNVHFGNTIQMVNALIEAGKQFRVMIYPNKTHGIAGSAARDNLFHMIQNHFTTELMGK